jgi:hypothetical protein
LTPTTAPTIADARVEQLVEELINLHAASATFRQIFRSQHTTQLFVDAFKSFVGIVSNTAFVKPRVVRLLEKVTHFALTLALDPDVSGSQKREVRRVFYALAGWVY